MLAPASPERPIPHLRDIRIQGAPYGPSLRSRRRRRYCLYLARNAAWRIGWITVAYAVSEVILASRGVA